MIWWGVAERPEENHETEEAATTDTDLRLLLLQGSLLLFIQPGFGHGVTGRQGFRALQFLLRQCQSPVFQFQQFPGIPFFLIQLP